MKNKTKNITINTNEIGMQKLSREIHFGIQLKYKKPHYDTKYNRAKNKYREERV